MNIVSYSLGAAGTVTGSKHILQLNDKKYSIDFGAWQGSEILEQRNVNFEMPDDIESVFLTHAHYDHNGLLPLLVKKGFKGHIYATPATRDLTSIILADSAKIQQHDLETPIYTEDDCIDTMKHFKCLQYEKPKKINDNLTVTYYNAGHILGSSMIDVEIPKHSSILGKIFKKKIHILYTGDLGRADNPICEKPATNMPAPDYLYLEATYGDRRHEQFNTAFQELSYVINRTVERGGKIIIPSFAVERSQELIYYIKVLMNNGTIPRIPVWIDSPMASNATGVFNIHPECFNENLRKEFISKGRNPFSVRTLKFVNNYKESLRVAKSSKPCIIISCNGMCQNGRIVNHLFHNIENPNNTVLIVGYMSENTLGRKILDKCEKVVINNKELELKCEVQKISAFSAHADYQETMDWLKQIDTSKLKKIFLVHGDETSLKNLKHLLTNEGYKVEIVEEGQKYKLN